MIYFRHCSTLTALLLSITPEANMSDPVHGKFNEFGTGVPDADTTVRPEQGAQSGASARRPSDPAKGEFVAGKFDLQGGQIPHARENISGTGAPGAQR